MRKKRNIQVSIFDIYSDHEIGIELKAISEFLDAHPEFLDFVEQDLCKKEISDTGRQGLSSETVLRCALLKQHRQLTYQELAFHLSDSDTFKTFARLPNTFYPKKSALQHTISCLSAECWEKIHRCILKQAKTDKIESARTIRIDSTHSDSDIHEPTDSSSLWDCVRVMMRLLKAAGKLPGVLKINFHNHTLLAKRRAYQIFNTKGMEKDKVDLYGDLIKCTLDSLGYMNKAYAVVMESCTDEKKKVRWQGKVERFKPLVQRIIDQTQRRVFGDEKVPAEEKVFSLFEDHTDVIIKGDRDIHYGHKLNLTSGKSGLILDVVVEQGNPGDIDRLLPMLKRHVEIYDAPPRQVAADGGYATGANLKAVKALQRNLWVKSVEMTRG